MACFVAISFPQPFQSLHDPVINLRGKFDGFVGQRAFVTGEEEVADFVGDFDAGGELGLFVFTDGVAEAFHHSGLRFGVVLGPGCWT